MVFEDERVADDVAEQDPAVTELSGSGNGREMVQQHCSEAEQQETTT
jgi:hypothetical protein